MEEVRTTAENIKELLRCFYSSGHRYIQGINRILDCSDTDSIEFSEAVGRMGWSGTGSFLDQVFCDLPQARYNQEDIRQADNELSTLMFILGSHAIKVDPNTQNNQAISSMLEIWKNRI